MKTIGKKIKAIYFLAVIAIVSMCMAIIPMMSTNVKADTEPGLKVVGANVVVIDSTTSSQNFDGKYAVSFKAEITKELYETLSANGKTVKLGMLVGPAANFDAVSSVDTAIANGFIDSCFLGNKDSIQYISFKVGESTCAYEGMKEFNEADIVAGASTDAEKIEALLEQSSEELTAIPYYSVNGRITLVKPEQPIVRSARKLINDAYALSNLEFGNELYSRYVGSFDDQYTACEYYVEKSTGKVYKSDANKELVPFFGGDFVGNGQLVVDAKDVIADDLQQLTLSQETMSALVDGQDYSIAAFLDDADNTVRTIKAKVVTKILTKMEDFFNDVDGDGIGDVNVANYIFHLDCVKNSYDGNYTTTTEIKGYYVLGANIDFHDNTALIISSGDIRPSLAGVDGGFSATLDGRGFALSNINTANSSAGFFGVLNKATIKNIAFDGFVTNRNDSTPSLLAYSTYATTFENVYIREKEYKGTFSDNYVSSPSVFGTIRDQYGKSEFTNVIIENTVALEAGKVSKFNRAQISNDTTSVYTNTAVIGLPSAYKHVAHETVADRHVLQLTITSEAMTALGVQAGEIALANCPEAVTDAYANLIANMEAKYGSDIDYINFIEDVSGRDYYLNNAGLVANTTATDAFVATGMWTKVGSALAWNSLVSEDYVVKSTNADPTDLTFDESITLEMYKGNEKIENITLRPRQEDLDTLIDVSGTTITKKTDARLLTNEKLYVDVSYNDGNTTYELTAELTLEVNFDKVNTYQSGVFIVEESTGLVYAPNANNELVVYDATGFLANTTEVYFGGELATCSATSPFALDVTPFANYKKGEIYPIVAMGDGEIKYLAAKFVSKVLFDAKDFFVDADGSGEVEDAEMIQANYIFYLGTDTSSGLIRPQTTIKGYYALANNINLSGVAIGNGDTGERHYQIADATGNLGFNGTLDGRGFALLNGNPGRTTGMFGMLYGATIKDIAFDGFTNSIGNSNALILGRVYNSTFENVYIRLTGNEGNDKWASAGNSFTTFGIADELGKSSFTNLICESFDGLAEGKTNRHHRFTLVNTKTTGDFTNTSLVGMPVTFAYAKHATEADKYVLSLTMSTSAMTALGVQAGEIAIADLPAAVTTAFGKLIANMEAKQASQIGYINFVEDTENRNYYTTSTALAADKAVADAYLATGCWAKLGDIIAWKSLINEENFTVKSNSANPENLNFDTSITLEMYYGNTELANVVITASDEVLEVVDIDGMTITKKAGVILTSDQTLPVVLTYSDGVNAYSKTVELTLTLDLDEITLFESGEFIVDKTTGEVFKTDADTNELKPYDATALTADMTKVLVAGAEVEVTNVAAFALSPEAFANAPINEDFAIAVGYTGGVRYLKVKAVTRVLSSREDFFVDADGSGEVEVEEMIQANYIFNLKVTQSSGAKLPSIAIKGYYVLASNIDLQGVSAITASTGDQTVQIWNGSADVGFRATLDGRGFALTNVNISTSASGGMFGALYGATIKNIAFDGFTTLRNDGGTALLGYVYNSTFENVYIRAIGNTATDSYNSGNNGVYAFAVVDSHGVSTFTNVIFENTDGMVAGATNRHMRATLTSTATAGNFENTALIGMPLTFKYATHATDTSKNVLSITISTAMMTKLGVEAKEYALADCPTDAYDNLIANIATRQSIDIGYVSFVVDDKERANYLDNLALGADTDVANAYVETGCWTKLGDIIAWKSLVSAENFTVKSNASDPESFTFTDSISIEMYYGATKLDGLTLEIADEFSSLVEIDGATISKKAGALLTSDTKIPVKVIYGAYSKSVEAMLQLDVASIETYESGEFIVDKSTGKVFKADANNELKPYDATNFTANNTAIYVGGAEVTPTSTTEFNLTVDGVKNLPVMEEVAITVAFNDGTTSGARYLKVKAVTKVFSTYADFFTDADGSGTVEEAEMIFDNNFFNQNITSNKATKKITGYYVLANNIDASKGALKANNSSQKADNTNEDFGFQGTFDGRGFALSNLNVFNGAGLFGLVKNATIKDVAFINLANSRDDGNLPSLARYIYDSTLENVYITVAEYWLGWNQNYRSTSNAVTGFSNTTLTNVIFENNAWKSNTANIQKSENSWYGFGPASANSTYTNVNSIGAPITVGYAVQVAAEGENPAQHKVVFTMPLASIQKYVAGAGVYALADCGGAQNDFAKLISGMNTGDKLNIQYIEFVAETSTRGYFYDYAALTANATATDAYTATGNWIKLGDELLWSSLADESQFSIKASDESNSFVNSIDVDMYYGSNALGAELSVNAEASDLVEISGNTVSRKATAQVLADKSITVTATYAGVTKTIDLTLLYDIDSVVSFEQGDYFIENSTGKVYKTNANDELVAYDATNYLGSNTTVEIDGTQKTVANINAFALNTADLTDLTEGKKYIVTAGDNIIVAKVVTKVLSTLKDFFNDADASGAVEDAEMTRANYIFNLMPLSASGAANPRIAIKGYYVLANNIDLQSNGNLCNRSMKEDGSNGSGDHTVQIFDGSQDVGFRGTLDGRGFALKNINAYGSSAGMFGAFYGATVKNIAFDGATNSASNGSGLVIGYVYNSTFENVYIRLLGNNGGDTYSGANNSWRALVVANNHGGSKITNLVVESVDGLAASKTNHHQRFTFGDNLGTYENTAIIGMPTTFSAAAHATDTSKYVLTLKMSASAIARFGVEAGEYALEDCEEAATAYANLIANLESRRSIDIAYINFVEDVEGRAYYLDSAALALDTEVANTYVETGFWKIDGGKLVWAK